MRIGVRHALGNSKRLLPLTLQKPQTSRSLQLTVTLAESEAV